MSQKTQAKFDYATRALVSVHEEFANQNSDNVVLFRVSPAGA